MASQACSNTCATQGSSWPEACEVANPSCQILRVGPYLGIPIYY